MQNPAPTISAAGTRKRVILSGSATGSTAILALALAVPQTALAGMFTPDETVSPGADAAGSLYLLMLLIAAVAVIAVAAALIRGRRHAATVDAPGSGGSATIAVAAGSVVFAALAILGALSLAGAASPDESKAGAAAEYAPEKLPATNLEVGRDADLPEGPSISVNVNGQQYLWRYTYLGKQGKGVYSYHELVIPAGVTVLLDFTSSDVTHSWWVPQLGGSFEAVPGYINRRWIRADKPGIYTGASTTYSGTNYPSMTTRVRVVPAGEFDQWIEAKDQEISEAGEALAETNSKTPIGEELKGETPEAMQNPDDAAQSRGEQSQGAGSAGRTGTDQDEEAGE